MYFNAFYDQFTEYEIALNEAVYALIDLHPSKILSENASVMNEAAINKDTIVKILTAIKDAIIAFTKKFQEVLAAIKENNAKWFKTASGFNIEVSDLTKFEFEMFPYWKNFNLLKNVRIPEYNQSDDELLKDPIQFRQKYFKNLLDDNGSLQGAKPILRGSAQKIIVKGSDVKSIWPKAMAILNDYEKVSQALINSNNAIAKVIDQAMGKIKDVTINESTLLDNSLHKCDMIETLLEAVLTPDKVHADSDAKENQGDNKEKNTSIEDTVDIMKNYVKECYAVNAIRMDVLEEAYGECARFVEAVRKNKRKEK